MGLLKQSTARSLAFLMVDSTDHLTGKTGLTVTVTLSKDAGAFAAAGGAVTEISSGWYKIALSTTDTNTLGDLALHCTSTGADATDFKEQVVAFDPTDAAALGLSRLDAAITSRLASGNVTVGGYAAGQDPATLTLVTPANKLTTDASGRVTVGSIVNGAIVAATFAANALDAVWSTATRTLTAFAFSVTVGTNNDKTGYTLSAAGVQAIWDALTSALTTAGSIGLRLVTDIDAAISSRLATSGYTAAPTTTQIWDEAIPGSHAAGTAAAKLNSASSAGDPWGTALPGAYGAGTGGNILGNLVASIWNAAAATYNAAGSLGQKLNAAGGAADPLTNAVPGTYPAGSAGYVLGTLPTGNGAIEWTYTLTRSDNGLPIAGATIEITSDVAGSVGLAGPLVTNSLGQITAFLPAGTVYVWRQANGYQFTNPQTQVVS